MPPFPCALQASKFGFPLLPDYASLVRGSNGEVGDVTVAAVTAAASAAAAAAAAAVVAAAGREIETRLQVRPGICRGRLLSVQLLGVSQHASVKHGWLAVLQFCTLQMP